MVTFYQFWLELFSDAVSFVAVLISFYYIFKLIWLGRRVELLAIKGGRGPWYIVLAIVFLSVNRLMDMLAEPLIPDLTADLAFALDDPPAALSAIFLALGLRSMYVFYIEAAKPPSEVYSTPNNQRTG